MSAPAVDATHAPARPRRVLLVGTYELGRPSFALASAAAWLARAGVAVNVLDLAVDSFDPRAVARADVVVLHVPMHTAARLALGLLPRIRAAHPGVRLIACGLYAPLNAAHLAAVGCDAILGGEWEAALVEEVLRPAPGDGPVTARVVLDRLAFVTPRRATLPPLERYTRLAATDGSLRLVGATEASRGCKHHCRHCPVVPVYRGHFRVVPREVVLADVRQQVAAGARHISFGDPDFWNGIGHALPLVEAFHREFPDVSYDVTIKIEHLRRHAAHLPALRDTGCAFVISAVESIDDAVLARFDKRHTRADFEAVVAQFRALGMVLQPTFVAFHPWITRAGYRELLAAIDALDLIEHVAPVQLSLRLLVTAGSGLLELPEVRALVGPLDAARLCHPWSHPDPAVDALQQAVEATVHQATARGEGRPAIFAAVRALAGGHEGPVQARPRGAPRRAPVPYLTEPWYC